MTHADVEAVHGMWTDPAVRRYLWDDTVISKERAQETVLGIVAGFERNGCGMWLIQERDDAAPCGFCGFLPGAELERAELIYGLLPRAWGRGYALESARAIVAHAFDRLNVAKIVAAADVPNTASIRLMERLGMRFDRREVVGGLDLVFYELDNPRRGAEQTTGSTDTAHR